ncbi:MAG TPA: GntR family transcriptional regulator [Gemmatimonadota bacterium]|nr:GntR family transcriptional regulator [Gemmatimonadota bacterium]
MRENLAADVADSLRQRIVSGELPSGQRINEVELAARLEVSRTPLREALSRLAAEGFVANQPRRGYFIQQLGPKEVEDLYQIRSVLDPAALELAGLPTPTRLDRLAEINRAISAADDPEQVIDLDDRWHVELLSHCPNQLLLDLIRQYMQRTRPLERVYLLDLYNVEVMTAEHGRILDALRFGALHTAVAALRTNMQTGLGSILLWLGSSSQDPARTRD